MAKVPDNWFKYEWPIKFNPKTTKADLSSKNLGPMFTSFGQILGYSPDEMNFYYGPNKLSDEDLLIPWDGDDSVCITVQRPLKPGTPLFVYEKYAKRSLRLKLFQDNSPARIIYFQPFNSCSGDQNTTTPPKTYNLNTQGGVVIGGAVGVSVVESEGGSIVGGEALSEFLYSETIGGGTVVSGESELRLLLLGMDGGAICAGIADVRVATYIYLTALGGTLIGGSSTKSLISNYASKPGIIISGTSFVEQDNINHIKGSGGIIVGGFALDNSKSIFDNFMNGGVILNGTSHDELIGADMVNARDVVYSPAGFVSRDLESKLLENVSVKDFGATGLDSQSDATTYIQNAINYAAQTANFNKTINFPNGIYNILGTITVPQGIYLKGEGSQGSTTRYGTVIKHKSNANCIEFTGSGDAAAGTGGGMENFLIVKANLGATQYTGGTAVLIEAQSTTNRPGEMLFTNVLIYGADTSYWSRCIEVDGTAANTSGTRGIRTINFRKVRVAEASTMHETVLFNQATHISTHGLAVDQGTGATAESGITIRGETNSVFLSGLNMVGTLVVSTNTGSNKCNHLHIDGKIQGQINIQDTQVDGTIRVSGLGAVPGTSVPVLAGALVNKSKHMKITSNYIPYVYSKITTPVNDITGGVSGPWYNVAFNSEVEDTFSNFNGTTFTCTCAGTYQIDYCVTLNELNSSHTRFDGGLYWSNGTNAQEFIKIFNPYATSTSGYLSVNGSHTINMAYGDTAYLKLRVLGNSQVVNVYGENSTQYSWIQIRYIS